MGLLGLLPGTGNVAGAGNLMPIADLYQDGVLVRRDGTLVRAAVLTSLNPWVLSGEEGDRVIDGIGRALAQLPGGARVMFLADASPIRLPDVLARTRAQARDAVTHAARTASEAVSLARLYGLMEEGLQQHASEDATIVYSYFLVVPYQPPGSLRQLRARARPLKAHREAVRVLDARMEQLRHALRGQNIQSTLVDGRAFARLLWAEANPTSADRANVSGAYADIIAATTTATTREAEEAAERARDIQARICLAGYEEDSARGQWMRVEDDVHVTLMMSRKPRAVGVGWMAGAMQIGHPFRIAVHLTVRNREREQRRLEREHNMLHSAAAAKGRRGAASSPVDDAHAREVFDVTGRLTSGEQLGFVDVALYQTIRVRSALSDDGPAYALDVARRARDTIVATTQAGVTLGEGEQLTGWQATTLLGIDPVDRSYSFTSDTAAAMLPIWGSDVGTPGGIPMFHSATGGLQEWDPMPAGAENFIAITVGAQGSGKTFAEIQRLRALLTMGIPGFVLDTSEPESHYKPLAQLVDGAVLELGKGSNAHRLNAWDVDTGLDDPAKRMQEKIQFVVDLHAALLRDRHANAGYGLDNVDEGLMLTAVETVYRWAAEDPRHRPCESLLQYALRARAEREHDEETATRLRRLAAALEQYVRGGQKAWLLDEPTTLPPGGALMTVFDLKAVPETMRAAVSMIVLDHIIDRARQRRYELAQRDGERYRWDGCLWVMIDEAAALLDNEATGRQMNFFGRKTRQLGMRVQFGTQRFADCDTPWGKALISSASEMSFLSQRPGDFPLLERLAGLSPHELQLIKSHVSMARGHESRFLWVHGTKRGLASLRAGTGAYWAATSHPMERPIRERAMRAAAGDPWAALDLMPRLLADELGRGA